MIKEILCNRLQFKFKYILNTSFLLGSRQISTEVRTNKENNNKRYKERHIASLGGGVVDEQVHQQHRSNAQV